MGRCGWKVWEESIGEEYEWEGVDGEENGWEEEGNVVEGGGGGIREIRR